LIALIDRTELNALDSPRGDHKIASKTQQANINYSMYPETGRRSLSHQEQ